VDGVSQSHDCSMPIRDEGLVYYRSYLKGDETGLEQIVRLYSDKLLLFINSIVNNIEVSEDLLSDTYLKLIVSKHLFREESSLKTYLYKIGRNLAMDYFRKQHGGPDISLSDAEDFAQEEMSLEQSILRDERSRQINAAMSKLNTKYREALYLFYFEGMPHKSIARVLKMNTKQVDNTICRAKQSLKIILEKEGLKYENL